MFSEAMSMLIDKLCSNNRLLSAKAAEVFEDILSAGLIADKDVLELAEAMQTHRNEYIRAYIASVFDVIALNKPTLSQKILKSLSAAIIDPSPTVRQQVVRVLRCVVQQQPDVAQNAMQILLTTMQEEEEKDLQQVICVEIAEIIAKSNPLKQGEIEEWLRFALNLISNDSNPTSWQIDGDLILWAVYDVRKIILPVLQESDPTLGDCKTLLKNLKSQNLNWGNWLIQITALGEVISSGGQTSPSIVDDLIEMWVEKKYIEKEQHSVVRAAFRETLVQAAKFQKGLSSGSQKKLISEGDWDSACILADIAKTGYLQLEPLVRQVENNLLEHGEKTLNHYALGILSYAAESGFKFCEKTVSLFVKLFNESEDWDEIMYILSKMNLIPYSNLIKIKIECAKDHLIRIFENTSTKNILSKFHHVPQISQVIAQRFTKDQLAVYTDNTGLCFWEDPTFLDPLANFSELIHIFVPPFLQTRKLSFCVDE
ncbi:MAG: hypothetical protein ACXU9U_01910 [Parachlamydiaceae bacterium]